MKLHCEKFLSAALFLLCLSGAVSAQNLAVAPNAADFESEIARLRASASAPSRFGLIPSPVDRSHLNNASRAAYRATYPALYDLRTLGRVTAVQDQLSCGSCWSFAAMASLESGQLPAHKWKFSENNLKNLHGFDWGPCAGGNYDIAAAYFTRWSGPVAATADPYSPYVSTSPVFSPLRHIQNFHVLPAKATSLDNDAIKWAVTNYGGVYVSFYMDESSVYYNPNTYAYNYTGTASTNHAVTIVGWNDNYSRLNFATTPAGNGAYIVKNSWGTTWGDSGYMYVSYYDTRMASGSSAVFYNAEDTTNYNRMYIHDRFGQVSSYGYSGSLTCSAANIFTAQEDSSLVATGIFSNDTNTSYTITIATGVGASPGSGTTALTTSGVLPNAGYHTIALPPPVSLSQGERFAVIVAYTNTSYAYPVPAAIAVSNYSSAATGVPGRSFISHDQTSWTDFTSVNGTATAPIRAFTLGVITPPLIIKAYPNPWKPGTGGTHDAAGITFSGIPGAATIDIYTVSGELVRTIRIAASAGGVAVWDGQRDSGGKAGSGIYLAAIKIATGGSKTIKVAVER